MLPRVCKRYKRFGDLELLNLGHKVVASMTKNKKLYSPALLLDKEQLQIDIKAFATILDASSIEGSILIQSKEEYRQVLIRQLNIIASKLNSDYHGHIEALQYSGFHVVNGQEDSNYDNNDINLNAAINS